MLISTEQIKSTMASLNKPPLPAIEYLTMITAVSRHDNKAGNGTYLKVEHTIQAPDLYKGERIQNFITIDHPNPKAVDMGKITLSRLAIGCCLDCLERAEDVLLKQVVVQTKHEEKDGKVFVKVKGYRAPAMRQAPAPDVLKEQWIAAGGVIPVNPISTPEPNKFANATLDDDIPF